MFRLNVLDDLDTRWRCCPQNSLQFPKPHIPHAPPLGQTGSFSPCWSRPTQISPCDFFFSSLSISLSFPYTHAHVAYRTQTCQNLQLYREHLDFCFLRVFFFLVCFVCSTYSTSHHRRAAASACECNPPHPPPKLKNPPITSQHFKAKC